MSDHVFNFFKAQMAAGSLIWAANANAFALLVDSSSTYVPADTQHSLADAKAAAGWAELVTTGYTAGGKNLSGLAATEVDGSSVVNLTASNPTWTALGATGKTVKAILVYIKGASDAASPLVNYKDSGGPLALNGSDVTINWASGSGVVLDLT